MTFFTEPEVAQVDEMSLSVFIRDDPALESWDIVVVLSRAPDLEPMDASEVDVALVDDVDAPFDLLDRPAGALVEFGGGLGTSVNAPYRFAQDGRLPALIRVRHRESERKFRVVPQADPG